ncbi:MAG: branched-chain amino acid ABC transporter permease [Actinobacteria bacterium]|nr:branched-chain amino acid ABC transporter permease [Actinomycetota bacterium]
MNFLNTLITGISIGAIYSLIAFALILVWRSTRVVNFAQAGQAAFSTYVGLSIETATGNYWIALLAAVLSGVIIGAIVEVVIVRFIVKHATSAATAAVAPVIAMLGLLGIFQGLMGLIWGGEYQAYPTAFSREGLIIAGNQIPFSPSDLFVLVVVVVAMSVAALVFQRTSLGLAMRAAAFAPEVTRLSGIRVSRIRTLGWAFAGGAGGLAGVLVAPSTFIAPNSFDLLLVFGFTAAVIGGLDSLIGGVLGGLALGIGLALVTGYLGGSFTFMTAFVLLIIVLLIRPQGILGARGARRA